MKGVWNVIFDILDEEITPQLAMSDRLILVLYDLGIATLEQIQEVSGWTKNQVKGAIQRVRKWEGEPSEWIRSWKPHGDRPKVYSLGEKGIEHARALRGEYADARKRPLQGHTYHFVGLNGILVRMIKEFGRENIRWLSGKESASLIYHRLRSGEEGGQNSPLRPDAMLGIDGEWWLIEYDTGTETSIRLEEKFRRYLQLAEMAKGIKMMFVTVSERRRQLAELTFERLSSQIPVPKDFDIAFLVEGEEPEFFKR